MVTTADFAAFQQQLRQEVTDVMQQLRMEENEPISGRMDMLNSINAALLNVSAKPSDSKPYRISDLLPRNWKGSNEKGEFRRFMSDLHLWMQAWSNQGEKMLVSVESTDKFDSSTIAFDFFRRRIHINRGITVPSILHRTTTNEPLNIVQRTRGQRGFEAWHAIVRRYGQRNMSDTNSAYAPLISNFSERGQSNGRGAVF